MWGEPPVELPLSQDSSLPRSTSETNLKKSICHLSTCSTGVTPQQAAQRALSGVSAIQFGQGSYKQPTHHNLPTLLCQVCDGGRGEVEVTSFERPQNHSVGDVTCSESQKLRKIVAFHQKEGRR